MQGVSNVGYNWSDRRKGSEFRDSNLCYWSDRRKGSLNSEFTTAQLFVRRTRAL